MQCLGGGTIGEVAVSPFGCIGGGPGLASLNIGIQHLLPCGLSVSLVLFPLLSLLFSSFLFTSLLLLVFVVDSFTRSNN